LNYTRKLKDSNMILGACQGVAEENIDFYWMPAGERIDSPRL